MDSFLYISLLFDPISEESGCIEIAITALNMILNDLSSCLVVVVCELTVGLHLMHSVGP